MGVRLSAKRQLHLPIADGDEFPDGQAEIRSGSQTIAPRAVETPRYVEDRILWSSKGAGRRYILDQAVAIATKRCPTSVKHAISPHVLRHTTAMKEAALAKLAPPGIPVRRFKPDDALLRFLATL